MPDDRDSFIILDSVDSTNNYAMGLLRTRAAVDGLAVFAREQTAGKGRRGKDWKSARNENIILSIILDTQHLPVHNQFQLSVVAALGCFDFFETYCNENVKIKWPNDLFWNDRKAGGILIENVIKGSFWQSSVIGIGININQIDFEVNNAVSLKQITGQSYDVVNLAAELRTAVMGRNKVLKAAGFEDMLAEYNQKLYCLNSKVKLRKANMVFETTIMGVSPKGELLTNDVLQRSFAFDEVEWVL